jgi:hypothetical protein
MEPHMIDFVELASLVGESHIFIRVPDNANLWIS